MRNGKLIVMVAVVLAAIGGGAFFLLRREPQPEPRNANVATSPAVANYDVLFSIPVGDQGIHYDGISEDETEKVGPSSIQLDTDGDFIIADSVAGRVLEFSREGQLRQAVQLQDFSHVTDAIKDGENYVVLDAAAPEPVVLRVASTGAVLERAALAPELVERGLSGISLNENRRLFLELRGGSALAAPAAGGAELAFPDAQITNPTDKSGREIMIQPPPAQAERSESEATISIDGRPFATLRTSQTLGGASVLATTSNGDVFVLVEEIGGGEDIAVDQTVRHYGPDGNFINAARVPVGERFTFVLKGVTVGDDGQAYALITHPSKVDVVRLRFTSELADVLPAAPAAAPPGLEACTRTRDQIVGAAKSYIDNKVFLTAVRINGDGCTHRQRPRYLNKGAQEYRSVPYDWGGFDSVTQYNNFMADGAAFRAGDRKESFEARTATADCSRGVDCSGFVSVCWGLASKQGTSTIHTISSVIPRSALLPGDILNNAGSHVVLFDRLGKDPSGQSKVDGLYVWESRLGGYDRVIHAWWPWSRFVNYKARRFRRVCL